MNSRFHTLKFLGLLLGAGLVSAPAMAEDPVSSLIGTVGSLIGVVSAPATASVNILSPLSINEGTAMNFGNVVSSSALGTVVLAPGGARTVTGGAGTMGQAGTVTAASFAVKGQARATYSVGLPVLPVWLIADGLPLAMAVTTFTSSLTAENEITGQWSGQLNTAGTGTFNVGATLNVLPNQASGLYTGTYSVLIAYN